MAAPPRTEIDFRTRSVPPWAVGLSVFLFLVGGVYFLSNLAGQNPAFAIPGATGPVAAPSGTADPAVGERLVAEAGCEGCHGADLAGQASFPSLHDVENGPVTEKIRPLFEQHPDDWIALWIDGTTPETEGIERTMPRFGEQYSRDQIDAMVAYLLSL